MFLSAFLQSKYYLIQVIRQIYFEQPSKQKVASEKLQTG